MLQVDEGVLDVLYKQARTHSRHSDITPPGHKHKSTERPTCTTCRPYVLESSSASVAAVPVIPHSFGKLRNSAWYVTCAIT